MDHKNIFANAQLKLYDKVLWLQLLLEYYSHQFEYMSVMHDTVSYPINQLDIVTPQLVKYVDMTLVVTNNVHVHLISLAYHQVTL